MSAQPANILELPVVPLRGLVVFPGGTVTIGVSRPATLHALRSMARDKRILCAAPRDPQLERPALSDLFSVGTLGTVQRIVRMGQDRQSLMVAIDGAERMRLVAEASCEPYLRARRRSARRYRHE